jgi:hypothetical protein
MGTGGSFPGVKRQERESDNSPPASAEVKKIWIYTSTPPYAFIIKHRRTLPFFLPNEAPYNEDIRGMEVQLHALSLFGTKWRKTVTFRHWPLSLGEWAPIFIG